MEKYLNLRLIIAQGLIFAFLLNSLGPPPSARAQDLALPAPGSMVPLSPAFNPPILKGIKVHPDNPFRFDFILDQGDAKGTDTNSVLRPVLGQELVSVPNKNALKQESTRLIKYFLASLTIPEKDLWVNLSPYEKNRIVPESFGQTEMGRDLLAEDYMLKQITASLIYPEDEIGKKFWKRVYEEAAKKFGTTNILVNTFNKVWIVPEKAVVYENAKAGTAYVVESKLKVMLEEDYLALEKNRRQPGDMFQKGTTRNVSPSTLPNEQRVEGESIPGKSRYEVPATNSMASQIVREIVIPELTKEVNEGKNFAQLRQVYNSLILATWYKKKIKDSILQQVYADKNKTAGVGYEQSLIPALPTGGHVQQEQQNVSPSPLPSNDALNVKATQRNVPNDVEIIYQRYLQAFKKGAYNYIKEEIDPVTQQAIPRKYFSGGALFSDFAMANALRIVDLTLTESQKLSEPTGAFIVSADMAMQTESAFEESSGHIAILRGLLQRVLRQNQTELIVDPNDPDIFMKFFKGRKVLNIGPEDNTFSGQLIPENVMTFLRAKGVDAFALSPADALVQWEEGSFIRGKAEDLPLEDNSFDDIVSINLFDPAYFDSLNFAFQEIHQRYARIAVGFKRVLKDRGKFYLETWDNPNLINALKEAGFTAVPIQVSARFGGAWVFVNHKDENGLSNPAIIPQGKSFNGDAAMRTVEDQARWEEGSRLIGEITVSYSKEVREFGRKLKNFDGINHLIGDRIGIINRYFSRARRAGYVNPEGYRALMLASDTLKEFLDRNYDYKKSGELLEWSNGFIENYKRLNLQQQLSLINSYSVALFYNTGQFTQEFADRVGKVKAVYEHNYGRIKEIIDHFAQRDNAQIAQDAAIIAKPITEVSWADLVKEGYRYEIKDAPNSQPPQYKTVYLYHNGEPVKDVNIGFEIFDDQKIVYIKSFYPQFPDAKIGRGRALLRELYKKLNLEGYQVISDASDNFQSSLMKMSETNPQISQIPRLYRANKEYRAFVNDVAEHLSLDFNPEYKMHLHSILTLANYWGKIPKYEDAAEKGGKDGAMLTVLENYKTQLREILKDHPDSLKILDSIHDPLELYYFSRFEEGKDPKAMGPIIQGLSEYLHRLNIIAQEINRLEPEEFWQLIRSNKSNPMGNAAMTGVMVEQPETLKYAVSQLQTALKRHPFSVFLAEPRHRELSVALDVIQDSQGRTFSRTMVRVYPFAKDDKIKQKQGVHGFPELKGIYHNLQLKDEFMPPSGTIGQITFFIILDKDGHAVLVFEENQPSYGFRHIKPSSAQKPYFIWVEALQKHIIGLAKQIGINQIYALSRDAISQVYLYNHTSTSTHFDPYKRPYREPYWQPKMVDVSTIYPFWPPGKQISVWEYVNPAMKAPGEKGGDGAMKTFEDFIREASNHALSYEEAEKFYEIWLGSKPKIPNIFWRYSKTIVNYVLVVLDRNIEGFRTAREIEDKTERVKKMAELYREYVIRHPGQKAFYTEKGGLYNLIDKLKHSPAELLLFVIDHGALKGLVDENNEYALKPWEIRTRNYPWTEDKLGKAATNAIIWYVPGFEKAMVEGNREEMVNLVSQVVLDHKGQNIGFFADVGGLKGLTNPHLGLTAYGITTTLLRLAVKYDSRLEGLRNSSILDRAMILDKATHMEHQNLPGGIDLTSDKALSVQNNDQGIKFHIDPAQLEQLQNAPGFVPVIINIQPLKSLSGFLGLNQTAPQAQLNHK